MTATPSYSAESPASILIVDDHPMMREGLALQISAQADMVVCGQAEDVRGALQLVEAGSPDLTLVDMSLKDSSGIDLITDIASRFPAVKTLALSAYEESLYAERALRAGAMGYLTKQLTQEKIFDAIRTVLSGKRYLSPEMTERLVGQAINSKTAVHGSPVESLTNRELEVFQLIGDGHSTGAIAGRLHLSVHTIESHRDKIKTRLGLKNGTELQRAAIKWVLENG